MNLLQYNQILEHNLCMLQDWPLLIHSFICKKYWGNSENHTRLTLIDKNIQKSVYFKPSCTLTTCVDKRKIHPLDPCGKWESWSLFLTTCSSGEQPLHLIWATQKQHGLSLVTLCNSAQVMLFLVSFHNMVQ